MYAASCTRREDRVESNLVHVLFMKLYIRDMRYSPFVGVIGSYPLSKRQEGSMWMILCVSRTFFKIYFLSAFKAFKAQLILYTISNISNILTALLCNYNKK